MHTQHHRYAPTRPETLVATLSYLLYRLTNPVPDPTQHKARLQAFIDTALPHGSLREAWIDESIGGDFKVAVRIIGIKSKVNDDGLRYVDPEALALFILLTLFGGHSKIKDISPRPKEGDPEPLPSTHRYHYVYVHEDRVGLTWQHVIAGAQAGQEVKLGSEHRDLRVECLKVTLSNSPAHRTPWKTREDAISESTRLLRDKAAKGHSLGLTLATYEAALRLCFRLLDDSHGHKLQREVMPQAAE